MDVVSILLPPVAIWMCKHYKDWLDAKRYEGRWEACNIQGRYYTPMPGASLTEISRRPLWSPNPRVLDVTAGDVGVRQRRDHRGRLTLDPASHSHVTRIVEYSDSDETSVQQIELSGNNREIYVTPTETPYCKHVLRRVKGQLGLTSF
jgi:hypothetical protein